jgi:uncharacterized protein (TIGR01777 family)
VIAGATGMVGKALVEALKKEYPLMLLGRSINKLNQVFPDEKSMDWETFSSLENPLKDIDLVINLSGENIGEKRWSPAQKDLILSSRVNATLALSIACAKAQNQHLRLFNASAIGVYGHQSMVSETYDETSRLQDPPKDFLSEVGIEWEKALIPAESAGISVVKMRFGVILSHKGGALAKMLPAFKWGLGGRIGRGIQPFSWISLTDLVRAIRWLIKHPEVTGPVNLVAPEIVTQENFAKTLGKILHRPTFFVLPDWLIKLQFGEMGEELLLKGTAVKSILLNQKGFQFLYPTLREALRAETAYASSIATQNL